MNEHVARLLALLEDCRLNARIANQPDLVQRINDAIEFDITALDRLTRPMPSHAEIEQRTATAKRVLAAIRERKAGAS